METIYFKKKVLQKEPSQDQVVKQQQVANKSAVNYAMWSDVLQAAITRPGYCFSLSLPLWPVDFYCIAERHREMHSSLVTALSWFSMFLAWTCIVQLAVLTMTTKFDSNTSALETRLAVWNICGLKTYMASNPALASQHRGSQLQHRSRLSGRNETLTAAQRAWTAVPPGTVSWRVLGFFVDLRWFQLTWNVVRSHLKP